MDESAAIHTSPGDDDKIWSTINIIDAGNLLGWEGHDIALLMATLYEMWEDSMHQEWYHA